MSDDSNEIVNDLIDFKESLERSLAISEQGIANLVKLLGESQAEVNRLQDRVADLLKSNNEFEQRARDAERQLKEMQQRLASFYNGS